MPNNVLKGAGFILLSELLFVVMGSQVKSLSQELPNEMIVFFRNLFGLQVILPLLLRQGFGALYTQRASLHLLRGLAGLSAMYCFFYAIANLPLANAMILKMSAPLFIPIIAMLWLGERLNGLIVFAVTLGFAGVALILQPDLEGFDSVALIAVAGGFFAAIAKTTVKKLTSSENPATIVFYFALTGMLLSSVPAYLVWTPPNAQQMLQLLLLGTAAASAQFVMTRAYSFAPASKISHYAYSSVLYASLLGWLFWDEWMNLLGWIGAAMVIASGMVLLKRERGGQRIRAQD
jgi:drug/metabolite transporter (DMT)-like permease